MEQGHQDAGTGGPDRMPQGDGAAVDVGDGRVDPQLAHHRQGLGGEGLIEFSALDVFQLPGGTGQGLAGCLDRTQAHEPRVQGGGGVGYDPSQGLEIVAFDEILTGHQDGCSAVIYSRGVARSYRAIRLEGRAQASQRGHRRVGARVLVTPDHDRISLALGNGNRDDLGLEGSGFPGAGHPGLTFCGEGVLLLSGQCKTLGDGFGRQPHVLVREHVGETIMNHRVDHLDGPHLAPLPNEVGDVGGTRHVLHPSRHDALGVTGRNHGGGQGYGLQARTADLVDRPGRSGLGNPGLDGSLPSGPLPQTGLQHATHQDLIHLFSEDSSPLKRFPDTDGSQSRCRNLAKPSQE